MPLKPTTQKSVKENFFSKAEIHDEGIITSLVRYKSAHAIARVFTRHYGMLSFYCHNAFRHSVKKTYSIQSPAVASLSFHLSKGDNLARLVLADLHPVSMRFSVSLKVFGFYNYLCEILEIFLPPNEPDEGMYQETSEVFFHLHEADNPSTVLRFLELKILHWAGYLPQINHWDEELFYNLRQGVFQKEKCPDSIFYPKAVRQLAYQLFTNALKDLPSDASDQHLKSVAKLFFYRLKMLHDKPLKSLIFLKELNSMKTRSVCL